MAETGRTSGGDLASHNEQPTSSTLNLPDAVEMDDLAPGTQAKPDGATASVAATAGDRNDTAPTKEPAQRSSPSQQESTSISQPPAGGTEPSTANPSAKAMGKAPATSPDAAEQDAIGPADSTIDLATSGELTVDIMLILPATGNRHPFRINEKYLKKRNVNVTGVTEDGKMDPFSITVYTLKELILRDWRSDWETPPREPTSIRLIKMGKMLDDKLPLNQYNFTPNVKSIVHMTVKPQEIVDEEEANKRLKEPGSQSGRSGCCVIL